MPSLIRNASYLPLAICAGVVTPAALGAQVEPPAGLSEPAAIQALIEAKGGVTGAQVWPGFAPDTIATLYVVPDVGKLFAHHRAEQPTGFRRYERRGWGWAGTETVSFAPGNIAFLTVDGGPAATLGLAFHEEFHEYEQARRREGISFGRRENALDVVTYPVYDVGNEADVALEGLLLHQAVEASTAADRLARVREFVAVRRARQARLPARFSAFEDDAELNEGLAQYALVRSLQLWQDDPAFPWRVGAERVIASELIHLDSLLETGQRSVRLRFYRTGAAMGLLLDALAGGRWKRRLMEEDIALDDLLAEVAGSGSARSVAELRQVVAPDLEHRAAAAVRDLARRRSALRDSLRTRAGVRVTLTTDSARLNQCGFDPQNTLVTSSGEVLHTRWLRLCQGEHVVAEFETPVVELGEGRRYEFVVPDTALVRGGGREWRAGTAWPEGVTPGLRLGAGGVTLDVGKTVVMRGGEGWVLTVGARGSAGSS